MRLLQPTQFQQQRVPLAVADAGIVEARNSNRYACSIAWRSWSIREAASCCTVPTPQLRLRRLLHDPLQLLDGNRIDHHFGLRCGAFGPTHRHVGNGVHHVDARRDLAKDGVVGGSEVPLAPAR